jgi:tetratricopeptide (TPR) repeat protein
VADGRTRLRGRWARGALALACVVAFGPAERARGHEERSETLARLDATIARSPGDPELWRTRAAIERRREHFARAHEDLTRAEALGLDPVLAQRERGLVWFAEGRHADAERALRAARDGAPDDLAALLAHARVLAALARWEEAAEDYARLVERAPRASPDVHLERVRALEAQEPPALAEALVAADTAIATLGPVPALAQAALAIELRAGQWDAALARLAQMADSDLVRLQRAEVLERAGRRDEAASAWAELLAGARAATARRGPTPAAQQLEARAQSAVARLEAGR